MLSSKKVAIAGALVCACVAFTPVTGTAVAGTPDQSVPVGVGGGGEAVISSGQSLAQTFRAGITGSLDQVDLYLRKIGAPDGPLSVEIRDAAGGSPGGTILGSAILPASSVPTVGAFVPIGIAANVTAGTQYAIVARTSATGNGTDNYGWTRSNTVDPYPAGEPFIGPSSGAGPWAPLLLGADLFFRTYVMTANAPGGGAGTGTTTPKLPVTGLRAAALKKCQKKKSKAARKKCKRKARQLPI
jgi:hypothetical protein